MGKRETRIERLEKASSKQQGDWLAEETRKLLAELSQSVEKSAKESSNDRTETD